MARERMVTRTVTATRANVLCLNIQTAEPFNQNIILSGTYKDKAAVERAVKKFVDNEEVKAVTVVDVTEEETLYGMPEQQFIELAKVLPPREKNEDK